DSAWTAKIPAPWSVPFLPPAEVHLQTAVFPPAGSQERKPSLHKKTTAVFRFRRQCRGKKVRLPSPRPFSGVVPFPVVSFLSERSSPDGRTLLSSGGLPPASFPAAAQSPMPDRCGSAPDSQYFSDSPHRRNALNQSHRPRVLYGRGCPP